MKMFPRIASMLAALVFVAACSSFPTNGAGSDRTRFEVETATVLLIEKADQPAKRAAEVVESINRLHNLLTDQASTVGDLRSALLKRVAERDLSVGEKALALQVVGRLADQVELKVGKGYLSPDAIVSIDQVLSWAQNMAALYVQN